MAEEGAQRGGSGEKPPATHTRNTRRLQECYIAKLYWTLIKSRVIGLTWPLIAVMPSHGRMGGGRPDLGMAKLPLPWSIRLKQ